MAAMSDKNGDDALHNAEEIIERFGGIRPMASKMDVPVTTVQGWKKRNVIPANRRTQVMEAAAHNNVDLSDLTADAANENSFAAEMDTAARTQDANKDKVHKEAVLKAARVSVADDDPAINDHMMAQIKQAQAITFNKSAWFTAAFVTVICILAVVFLLPSKDEIKESGEKIAQITEELKEVQDGQELLKKIVPEDIQQRFSEARETAENIQQQVTVLSTEVQGLKNDLIDPNLAVSDKIESVAERVTKIAGPSQLTDMLQKIQGMQSTLEGQTQLTSAFEDLQALFSSTKLSGGSIESALLKAQGEEDALGEALGDVAPDDLKAAALLLGMSQFRTSLNRSESFEADLALMQEMLAEDDPELQQAIARLAPKAKQGVLTPDGLKGEFKGLAGDIVVSSLKGEDVSVQEKAKARFNDLLSVEKEGELITGTDTQAKVARAQNMLDEGNIEGAIAELQSLEGEAASTAQPFIDEASATLMAEELQGLFTGRILERIRGGSASVGSGLSVTTRGANIEALIREVEKMAPRRIIRPQGTNMLIMEPKKQIVPGQ